MSIPKRIEMVIYHINKLIGRFFLWQFLVYLIIFIKKKMNQLYKLTPSVSIFTVIYSNGQKKGIIRKITILT